MNDRDGGKKKRKNEKFGRGGETQSQRGEKKRRKIGEEGGSKIEKSELKSGPDGRKR